MQSERLDGVFYDDIFGETPTGVRKAVRVMLFMHFVVIYVLFIPSLFILFIDLSRIYLYYLLI